MPKQPYRGYTEAQNRATQKYIKETYKRFAVTFRNDESPNGDDLKAAAAAAGKSANKYIKDAIIAYMRSDRGSDRTEEKQGEPMKL